MKLKTWMEAHIVRSRWKNKKESKKEKRKKGSELSVTVAPPGPSLDSAGNSPSSPDPPDGAAQHIQTSPICSVLLTLPPPPPYFAERRTCTAVSSSDDDRSCYHQQNMLCPCFGVTGVDLWCPADASDVTPVHHSPFRIDRLQDHPSLNSPRQRSKIRTNPWLTPKKSVNGDPGRPSLTSCSSMSDCGSAVTDRHQRDSLVSSGDGSDVGPVGVAFSHDDCAFRDEASPQERTVTAFLGQRDSRRRRRRPSLQQRHRPEADRNAAPPPDSDSEDCDTLNEMGNFDESYEYDRETDILDDAYDAEDDGRRRYRLGSRRRHQRAPPTTLLPVHSERRLKDLSGNDEDYSEKLEFADVDEAYSEASGSLEDDDEVPVRISILGEEDDCGTQTDSAFPSDSELSSLVASAATTPLFETAVACSSSSGSDSGIQQSAAAAAATRGRSLERIRESLEDKVRRLRLERLLVDEKIREAREEESMRRSERERFQRELIVHRRQVLLRTLHDLRLRLEEQSNRLHDAYQTTLQLQLLRRRQALGSGQRVSLGRLM